MRKIYIISRKSRVEFDNCCFNVGSDNPNFRTYKKSFERCEDGSMFIMLYCNSNMSGDNYECKILSLKKDESTFEDDNIQILFENILYNKIIRGFDIKSIRNSIFFESSASLRVAGMSFKAPISVTIKDEYDVEFFKKIQEDDFTFKDYEKVQYLVLEEKKQELLDKLKDKKFIEFYIVKDNKFIKLIELDKNINREKDIIVHEKDLNIYIKALKDNNGKDYINYFEEIIHKLYTYGYYLDLQNDAKSLYAYFCADKKNKLYEKHVFKISQKTNELENNDNNDIANYNAKNTIFYGVPGCGKSYYVNKLLEKKNSTRILFHPEYTYSDFVGQIMPLVVSDKISYDFVPGPFTKILKDAVENPEEEYYLVIEEINRGNAPAIFGDVFQLLDRDSDGKSEYKINNKDIASVIYEKIEEDDGKIYIPSNLTIFATMNTCDQNVFTIDTAFKRRWRMKRIENDFEEASISNVEIKFNNGITFSWGEFAKCINNLILTNDGINAEDKQLGVYFVKEDEIKDIQVFAEKVLMYLWEDVARYDKTQLFNMDMLEQKTLDCVIRNFVSGKNVFVGDIFDKLYKNKDEINL